MMKGLRVLDAVRKANDVLVEQVNLPFYDYYRILRIPWNSGIISSIKGALCA